MHSASTAHFRLEYLPLLQWWKSHRPRRCERVMIQVLFQPPWSDHQLFIRQFISNRVRRPPANPQIKYGSKYGPMCHQWHHADVTNVFTLAAIVTASVARCWLSDVMALSHHRHQKSALTADPIGIYGIWRGKIKEWKTGGGPGTRLM